MTLKEACRELSISVATGRNWVRLGKLIPENSEGDTPLFSAYYIQKVKAEIASGENGALKSRRNKKFISGNELYASYVSEKCRGLKKVQELLALIREMKLELTDEIIRYLVADSAVSLFEKRFSSALTLSKDVGDGGFCGFLLEKKSFGQKDRLINDLIGDKNKALDFYNSHRKLFDRGYSYEDREDILGLLYISCKNLGNRKASGSYYTPGSVVKRLVENVAFDDKCRVLDPCCGTGNFLLQLPDCVKLENVYGNDLDLDGVMITRINMALKYRCDDIGLLHEHFTCSDYLSDDFNPRCDTIIGNPPWGYEFSETEKEKLRGRFIVTAKKSFESYDVFVEKAVSDLPIGGVLAFVLPEAIINVKNHRNIRELIIGAGSIESIEYLGEAFDGVNCPSVILQIRYTGEKMSTYGMKVRDRISAGDGTALIEGDLPKDRDFIIKTHREIDPECFNFLLTDEEYKVLQKVEGCKTARFLKDNADFALGIVTGNNKKYISDVRRADNEIILKGSDIRKYRIQAADNYITFKPECFQQVAPEHIYRAPEKLFYRFISSQLVFAYDNQKTLSLNSCNIVIPRIEGLCIKYVLAVLNSSVSQFVYRRKFRSVKVLRAHIESIPIPYAGPEVQEKIVKLAEVLISGQADENDPDAADSVGNRIDETIMDLFELSAHERKVIRKSLGL